MAEELDLKETLDFKELLMSEVIQHEALINVLTRKGFITRQELIEEIDGIAARLPKAET